MRGGPRCSSVLRAGRCDAGGAQVQVPEPGAASCMQLGGVQWEHLQVAKNFCMVC